MLTLAIAHSRILGARRSTLEHNVTPGQGRLYWEWSVKWGGWGSNPRPADYESSWPPIDGQGLTCTDSALAVTDDGHMGTYSAQAPRLHAHLSPVTHCLEGCFTQRVSLRAPRL